MKFTIQCTCGQQIDVIASQAGTELPCACGRLNKVPSLGELRRQTGLPKYEVNACEKISQMLAAKELPAGDRCAMCSARTDGVLECVIECERSWSRGAGWLTVFVTALFTPIWLWQHLLEGRQETFGREVTVRAPLRMCPRCQEVFRRGSQRRELKELLRQVPAYRVLLGDYPNATVLVA